MKISPLPFFFIAAAMSLTFRATRAQDSLSFSLPDYTLAAIQDPNTPQSKACNFVEVVLASY